MIKHLSSFSPTFLLRAYLILVTICPLLRIHTLKKIARSFAHAPGAPDYQFHHSTLSYGGDDPDSKFQCLLGHVKHLHVGNLMTWLGRISNAASAIGIESNSTRLSSVLLYSVLLYSSPMPGGIGSTAMSYPHQGALQGALPPNAPLPSSASLNFHVITSHYIKHCIQYHKLCKTHAYGIQVDQGERTACKNRTFTSTPSTASSLYPVSHPVTDIDFNQQRSKWR
ncbi:hypothetical protein B0H14DRAFT_2570305 [Mycena olivaceomarginata]|nr:hypothetical protein B0H14DRAFT_2570305 [Mycena olivaceomarginata]